MPSARAWEGPDGTIFCPIQRSSPPLGWMRPYIALTRGRLAGAVLAEQGVNFGGMEIEIDVVVRAEAYRTAC